MTGQAEGHAFADTDSGSHKLRKKHNRVCPDTIANSGEGWCGREDSNFHEVTPTSTSSLRVYHSATTAPW